ncbi:HAMP domain-containing histidine kinase [Streptomyces ipomoeae]|uniref:histidine kinase n=2 Tax=Streptomyces ipomoeae TaxID=103232 RepID=L1KHZ3_9ACTN|nr:HAMP domain-containing sensor histidine kinase [Streptomyces ipomoeae]EKX60110.1 ATPase/histidine kinase/DNA gyrase B/HSP90 domain protein [Streptomyces ipomoeae 91-03]MDX2693638.1 HAMP domain-containing sensor histidine kinase [Streptomyces ipomoeae]MDX2819707.1 HAMP domain-containing sensor histidine kinase [Streptomyces ipomoeae]MDX2876182.1 HAMP domain-containing sensor histidine kinase [Streptomyces ipomoeae]TQE31785.1 HAMP domain-containing histidine kinase [Streptomyces ipomoeae]
MTPLRGRGRSLRARLVLFTTVTLAVVCAAMALATVLVQRAHLLDDLDQRVRDAVERSQGGAHYRAGSATDLSFLSEQGQPAGTVAARLSDGEVTAAEVVTEDGDRRTLTAAQRAALSGVTEDGTLHTRTIPGLGTYRVTAVSGDGAPVLAGLPMDAVQDAIHQLIVTETVIAGAGLAVAGCVCAVVIRRRLRPLGRVAATAVEVARAPLDRGEVAGLTRVPAGDTDPATEVGQVGAALNYLIDRVESSLAGRQRSEERMRRFLADASHELRTPLASIAGYAELMDRGGARIEPQLAWRRVSAQSARMTGLVEDLLLLARLDEGRPLQAVTVNLATLVAEAVWDARAAGGDHDWQLALRLDEPATVTGDPARLTQVVANLLANARVHTPPGTRITVAVETTRACCVIRVRDDGPGIPPALLPTVFERFTRADTSRTRTPGKGGGSGLGLAIAAAITQAHGGGIDVESEPGRTEFTVTLPCAADLRRIPSTFTDLQVSHAVHGDAGAVSPAVRNPVQLSLSSGPQGCRRWPANRGRAHDEGSQRR